MPLGIWEVSYITSRDFCYWLQGFFEVAGAGDNKVYVSNEQVEMIKKHLNMVFYHEIDPSHGDKEHQGKLNALHQGSETLSLTTGEEGQVDHLPGHPATETGVIHTDQPQQSTAEEQLELPLDYTVPDYMRPGSGVIARC